MKTTYQVIRDHESGQYEDYIHNRDVVFETINKEIALTIARMECEDDRKQFVEYGHVSDIEEIICGGDEGFQFTDGDETTVCFFVHQETVYETLQEYMQYRKIRERKEREHELAHTAHHDFYETSHVYVQGPIDYTVTEIHNHITVDFWTRGESVPMYQCQYDNGELCAVRKWDRRLPNGNCDPDSCTIYMM